MDEWQNRVDDPATTWIKRLWQRGEQPGVVRLAQARDTARRLTGLGGPPLADEVARRYVTVMALQQQMPPIVYAEPQPVAADRASVSNVQSETVLPLPVATSQLIPSHPATPLSTAQSLLPVVNVPNTPQPQSRLTSLRPQPIPTPSTTVVPTAHSSLPLPTMPQPQNRPPAAAPMPHLPHTAVVASTADTPVASPSLPLLVVRPQMSGQTQAQPVTRPVATIPTLPKPVSQATITSTGSVMKTATVSAAATPQSPTYPPTTLPLPRTREAAAAEHTPASPPKPVVIAPATLPVAQPNRDETPLPVVREQFAAPSLPTAGFNQSLPLARPPASSMGNVSHVVQRKAHTGTAHQPAPSRQPSPAPNRIVRTNSVIQRAPLKSKPAAPSKKDNQTSDEDSDTSPAIDMDELVDKVHRQFLRRLTVEGERRGKTSWP